MIAANARFLLPYAELMRMAARYPFVARLMAERQARLAAAVHAVGRDLVLQASVLGRSSVEITWTRAEERP